jgi:hypothetical protein
MKRRLKRPDNLFTRESRDLRQLGKLAMPSKPLNEILGEMMAEAGPMIFQAMQR